MERIEKLAMLYAKQSKIDKDFSDILELIKPVIVTGRSITEREIKKAQKLINEKYGLYDTFTNSYTKELVEIPMYRIYKDFSSEYSQTLNIRASDRSITFEKTPRGDDFLSIPNDTKTIYLERDRTIAEEEYSRYIGDKKTYTKEEILEGLKQYEALEEEKEAIEEKQSKIKYHYEYKNAR